MNRSIRTPFLSLLARTGVADLRPEQFSPDGAKRLRRQQLRRTIEQMRIMLACNTFFAPVLSFQAWNAGINGLVIIWTATMIVFSWVLFFRWRKMYHTDGRAEHMRQFVHETFVNALLWAIGMLLFYPVVSGEEKTLVTTVMAGSLALGTVGFSRAPSAAFVYVAVLTAGNAGVAFVTGIVQDSTTDLIIAFLSTAAGASVFNASLERGKSSIIAFRAQENLSEQTEVVELLLKDYEAQATEWLWQTDAGGNIIRAPDQILEWFGVAPDDANSQRLIDLLLENGLEDSAKDLERLEKAFAERAEFHDIQFSVKDNATGEIRWILMKGRPQKSGDRFSGFRGIFADATVSVVAEKKVQFAASFDSLTKLHNRNATQKQLAQLRPAQDFAAGLLIDLDGFKQVNDSYGHHIGDLLLAAAADRLRDSLAEGCFAARLGGDEFFVLLTRDTPLSDMTVTYLADQIVDALSMPFQVESYNINLSASLGVTRYPQDTDAGQDLLFLADLALYKAKNSGRNRFEFFHPDMQKALSEKMEITEKLRDAVKNNQIVPYYQSQHALRDGKLIGFEALARWIDPDLGFVGPDVFIPIAEQTGLIVDLGEQLLRAACTDASKWVDVMGDDAPVLSVNFSPVQFARTDVASLVARVLKETGYPPTLLEVEITEGVLIANKELMAHSLREISALGVSIALDDFGTGYSSLSYLHALPLDRLKIDRSFVTNITRQAENPIISSIIQLGHSLGLSVIAEGIEEQEEIDKLLLMGCDDAQGYFFSKPVPVAQADMIVAKAVGLGTDQMLG